MQKRNYLIWPCLALLTGATAALLAGCEPDTAKPVTLSGELTYPGDASVAPKSNARISMLEHGEEGGNKRIVAERSLHEIGQKPIKFDIDVDRNLIDPQGKYGLRAEIIGPGGNVNWTTPQPVQVKPLQRKKPVSIKLQAARRKVELTFNKYRCADGFHLNAARSNEQAVVLLGNRRLVLKPVYSANEQQYKDEHGNALHAETAGLVFRVDGGTHDQCRKVDDQTPGDAAAPDASAPADDQQESANARPSGQTGPAG